MLPEAALPSRQITCVSTSIFVHNNCQLFCSIVQNTDLAHSTLYIQPSELNITMILGDPTNFVGLV